jgi:hypothetical protein
LLRRLSDDSYQHVSGRQLLESRIMTSAATLRLDDPHIRERTVCDPGPCIVRQMRRTVEFTFAGHKTSQPRWKGFLQIPYVLARSWKRVLALEVDALGQNDLWRGAAATSPDLLGDAEALDAYRRNWLEAQAELAAAERTGDPRQIAEARRACEALHDHLTGIVGLAGRARSFPRESEQARRRVKGTLDRALSALEGDHPPLWRHLQRSLETGTYLMYAPDPLITWEFH